MSDIERLYAKMREQAHELAETVRMLEKLKAPKLDNQVRGIAADLLRDAGADGLGGCELCQS